ncbi:DUF1178 family protein [Croceicoccus mobilis]|uniref:DUF1178 family protein n=1 Tax=Croceicoccus mobilis TaxID=1703339 RepID=A0A916YVA3_9SPHN|nr:DUF1178 family protein [Croceicoccus mobilis]GGD63377.1 hypothetical protein GCM10010990_11080 [Croceicoccus mobilis]
MIVFDLRCCNADHRFEGWFRSSADFEHQRDTGLLCCPHCGSHQVEKAVMAPAVGRKGNQIDARPVSAPAQPDPTHGEAPAPPASAPVPAMTHLTDEAKKALISMAAMQQKVLSKSKWVGNDFAEEARAMHYGEREVEAIHGQTSREEAAELVDEGIDIAPLPFPVGPPEAMN